MKLVNIGCGHHYHSDWINLDLYRSKFVTYHDIKNKLPFPANDVDVVYDSHLLEHITKKEAKRFIDDCYRILKPGGIMRVAIPDMEMICREYLSNLDKGFDRGDQKAILNYMWNKIELFDQVIRRKNGGEMLDTIKKGEFNEDYVRSRNGEELEPMLDLRNNKGRRISFKEKMSDFLRKENQLSRFAAGFIKKADPQRSGEAHRWMYDKLDLKILLESVGFRDFTIVKYDESRIPRWDIYALDKAHGGNYPRKPDSLFVEVSK
ncbi:MAG TPA: methyltransferase domain-containing protein [Candidatus Paceibacterota bacterium]|nr:methyltransferase domain-containing protein [Candidatus Paceibacterota bacterium]